MAPSRRSGPSNNEDNPDLACYPYAATICKPFFLKIVNQSGLTRRTMLMVEMVEMMGTMRLLSTKGLMHAIPKEYDGKGGILTGGEYSSSSNEVAKRILGMSWTDFKELLVEESVPSNEME
ncbi:hypothetical protein Tco_0449800 [Tanacetum coccineum]